MGKEKNKNKNKKTELTMEKEEKHFGLDEVNQKRGSYSEHIENFSTCRLEANTKLINDEAPHYIL